MFVQIMCRGGEGDQGRPWSVPCPASSWTSEFRHWSLATGLGPVFHAERIVEIRRVYQNSQLTELTLAFVKETCLMGGPGSAQQLDAGILPSYGRSCSQLGYSSSSHPGLCLLHSHACDWMSVLIFNTGSFLWIQSHGELTGWGTAPWALLQSLFFYVFLEK